jgi:methionyl-tRNA synthetase
VGDIDLSLDDFINRVNSELVGKLANWPAGAARC